MLFLFIIFDIYYIINFKIKSFCVNKAEYCRDMRESDHLAKLGKLPCDFEENFSCIGGNCHCDSPEGCVIILLLFLFFILYFFIIIIVYYIFFIIYLGIWILLNFLAFLCSCDCEKNDGDTDFFENNRVESSEPINEN